ncbi:BICC [Mytilus edulis]|uniref:BICC1 n=1 Tax=Mytilus edulis TaxID=6550 RepID=A0A8S3S0X8_MYTED|nr:BICC [Mytilus edulis]
MSSAKLRVSLYKIDLGTLYQKFLDEKIEDDSFNFLTDEDLKRLGVETIGDRIRLRESMRHLDVPESNLQRDQGMYRNFELPDIDPPSPEPLIDRDEPEDTNLSVGVSLDVGTRNEESQIEIDEPEDAIPPLGVSLDVGTRNEEPHISTETGNHFNGSYE